MGRRRRVVLVGAWLAVGAVAVAEPAGETPAQRLTAAAQRLLIALPVEAAVEGRFAFGDDEREDVHFAPFPLDGARQDELPDEASRRIDELLAVTLSRTGYEKVQAIRGLEAALAKQNAARFFGLGRVGSVFHDAGRYFVALFGTPSGGEPWAYRYEGHHVSLHVTVANRGAPATTPLFLGAQPRVVPEGFPGAGTQPLREEEERGRALHAALPDALRARATLAYEDDRGLLLGQVRRVASAPDAGVARGEMPEAAQARFDELLEALLGNFATEIADARRDEIDGAGRDALRFAFAEAAEPAHAFYWRISGPRTLVELDNTTDGDHLHLVWHDLQGDFGDDLLAAHLREEHGAALAR